MNSMIEIASPLGPDLLVRQVSGEESLSRLFEYRLELLSAKAEVDPDALLGQTVTIKLEQANDGERHFNGHVTRLEQTGHNGRHFTSQAVVRPWLWFLTRKTDCRIHQDLTVPEILKLVFDEYPDIAVVDFRLSAEYRKWEYCVQYRESDFNFVSRLMEHEGIYYYFEHSATQHKLVLVDAFSAHKEVPGFERFPYYAEAPRARPGLEYIQQWRHAQDFRSGQYSTLDYDFKLPQKLVHATKLNSAPPALSNAEVFDYPGGYIENPHGEQYAEVRLGELQTGYESASGTSNVRALHVGFLFGLTQHPTQKRNTQYLVTRTSMQMSHPAYESGAGGGAQFGCSFSVIPARQQFRPRRSTQKPVVQGPQTAVVVGADGDEIYVDSFGRVKVKFFWDRHEPKDNKEENRSCWIRVSQAMAGKNWGFVSIPRVKQEVIVDFIEGDPDQPIITGRVYNGDQMPPYELPGNATQSGLKTRSSKGGSPANFNEIRFEDKKGSEQVYIHAEKDKSVNVENDDSTSVGHDQTLTVGNDQRTTVKHDQFLTVDHQRTIHVKDQETHTVDKDQILTVVVDQKQKVIGSRTSEVKGTQTSVVGKLIDGGEESMGGATRIDITSGGEFRSVSQNQDVRVKGNQGIEVTGELVYKAKRMYFEAEHIEHKITGANSVIHESPNGPYSIFANDFKVNSNTNIALVAMGDIDQICMKHTVQKMGPSEDTCFSASNSFKIAATNDVFVGFKSATNLALSLGTDLGVSMSHFGGLKIENAAGISISQSTMRVYAPGVPPAMETLSVVAKSFDKVMALPKAFTVLEQIHAGLTLVTTAGGVVKSQMEPAETTAAKKAAQKKLLQVAKDALDAGHPSIAYRAFLMSGGVPPGNLAFTGATNSFPDALLPELRTAIDMQMLDPKSDTPRQMKPQADNPAAVPAPLGGGQSIPDQAPPLGPVGEPPSQMSPDVQAPEGYDPSAPADDDIVMDDDAPANPPDDDIILDDDAPAGSGDDDIILDDDADPEGKSK